MHIVIVGGGTAGWLAAFGIAKILNHKHKLTIIESTQIGIIGAGEGTTGVFTDFLSGNLFQTDIDIEEFIKETNATIKQGIHHINWTGNNSSYMAPIGGSPSSTAFLDTVFLNKLSDGAEKMHTAAIQGYQYENNYRPKVGVYHFDAFKVGEFFKKKCLAHPNTSYIDGKIVDVILSETGDITSVKTENNLTIEADFFIDCSGLRRILMSKLDVDWHSYRKNLPVNAALPFQLPLDKDYKQLTTAHALKNGWMWKIPTAERFGCGYVYSDTHTTPEQAQQEIEELLGHEITPIRNIKFEAGRSDLLWKNNCLSLGLAAAFAEPLEATSIHTTVIQLVTFVFEYLQETKQATLNQSRINAYNSQMTTMYDDIRDFLVLHYQGGRTDSEFWKQITNKEIITDQTQYILEMAARGEIPSITTFKNNYNGMPGAALYNWILAGLGKITPSDARQQLEKFNAVDNSKKITQFFQDKWDRELSEFRY